MSIQPSHSSILEAKEYWYDTKEKALLFEVVIEPSSGRPSADHSKFRNSLYNGLPFNIRHNHRDPHGISLQDAVIGEHHRKVSNKNTELIIRLWHQIENDNQPLNTPYDEPALLPVSKALALFLAEKKTEMHKDESLTQALILMQTHITAKATPQCH